MLKIKKKIELIQEADLQLAVCYIDNDDSPGSHCELDPLSVCANGWILPSSLYTVNLLVAGPYLIPTEKLKLCICLVCMHTSPSKGSKIQIFFFFLNHLPESLH